MARDLERFLKECGDSVPAMDVADWMMRVFPDGAARLQGLIELAAHVSAATAEETVVRVPSSPPVVNTRGSLPSLPTLPVATTAYDPPPTTAAGQSTSVEVAVAAVKPVVLEDNGEGPVRVVTLDRPTSAHSPSSWGRRRWVVAGLATLAALGIRAVVPSADLGVAHPTSGLKAVDVPVAERPVAVTAEPVAPSLAAADDVVAVDSLPALTAEPEAAAAPTRSTPSTPARVGATEPTVAAEAAPTSSPTLKNGDVYVTTPGGAAEVLVDGRSLGRTPGKFSLSVGRHELLLRGAGGVERVVSVAVVSDSPTLVTLRLAP